MQLGAVLLEQELISEPQLKRALAMQQQSGARLGDILVSEGITSYLSLYRSVAKHHNLPFVDLIHEPPQPFLLRGLRAKDCLKHKAIPWRKRGDGVEVAVSEMNTETTSWAHELFGKNVEFVITSPWDIRRSIERHFAQALDEASRLKLWRTRPYASARATLSRWQKNMFVPFMCVAALMMIHLPLYALLSMLVVCHVAYSGVMFFKCVVFAVGAEATAHEKNWPLKLATLDEQTLPVYTILVPMYREAESLPGLLRALERLDYPPAKLDIKLVLESDDTQTYEMARALKPRHHFEIIRVPKSQPRTKPKACNYALHFARGEIVTVFDADDLPEPQQLKKAVYAFRNLPSDVACLQARLNYHNAQDNWLTRFFSLEYTLLFRFMLYGLERLSIPIPLGGTSNHIALSRLRALGEWDPFNVTEDADLGTRLAAHGLKTAMLDSDTLEEAPIRVGAWIRQRSRWIKGYMQTWLVHMRHPARLYRMLGFRGFIGFQCFIGLACFTFLSMPLVWAASLLWISNMGAFQDMPFPNWLAWLTMINLIANFLIHWVFTLCCAAISPPPRGRLFGAALLYPFYLVLHSIASYKALWQLIVRPHFWEKTAHGFAARGISMPKPVDSGRGYELQVQPILTKAKS